MNNSPSHILFTRNFLNLIQILNKYKIERSKDY